MVLHPNLRHRMGIAAAVAAAIAVAGAAPARADNISFHKDVYPIFAKHCIECHHPGGDATAKTGLDMSTYEGVMKGTTLGPVVVPGDAFTSNLMVLIEGRAKREIRMPHSRKPLEKWERVLIRRWINDGAKNN